MSFIEKNKVWLLPLLGAGILGVGYMNFQTLRGEPPPGDAAAAMQSVAEQSVAEQPAAGQPAAESPAISAPALEPSTAEGSEDLWSDLKPFAVLPGNLAQEGLLRDRARLALGPEPGREGAMNLGKPGWASLAPALPPVPGSGSESAGGELPELDFLIHSPRGSFAWFGGRPYRTGEKVLDSGYTLSRIGPTSVELTGPSGKLVVSTIPVQAVASHSVETP